MPVWSIVLLILFGYFVGVLVSMRLWLRRFYLDSSSSPEKRSLIGDDYGCAFLVSFFWPISSLLVVIVLFVLNVLKPIVTPGAIRKDRIFIQREKDRKKILEDAKHLGLPMPDEKNQQDKKPFSEITPEDIYRADAGTAAKFQDDYKCLCGCEDWREDGYRPPGSRKKPKRPRV